MQLADLSWPALDALSRELPVIIPIAAVEQHGHHLPLATDSLLLQEVVKRVETTMPSTVLVTPLMWLGNSHHHLDFPGTLSAEPRVYLDLVSGMIDNVLQHGFRRLLLLNGHGGNDTPGKQAAFEVRQRYRSRRDLLLLFSTYWSAGPAPNAGDDPSCPALVQSDMGHACEWETSMMLRIAPHLVGDYLAAEDVAPGNPFRPASRAWITKDRSELGHIGAPAAATSEKGEYLLAHFSRHVQALLTRMLQWDGTSWEG